MIPRERLDSLYARYNRPECVGLDPVQFLHECPDAAEREVVGLIAALLAYGRVEQIIRSVGDALGRLDGRPREFLLSGTPAQVRRACRGFRHRVTSEDDFARLLLAVRHVLRKHGSIEACFAHSDDPAAPTVLPGLSGLAGELEGHSGSAGHLTAHPERGSACKRWNLYLRWLVRSDNVDPGGWTAVSPARLIIPLDAHMWRICSGLGMTRRRTPNMRAALEITAAFRRINPEDPVRYDFALMHASREGRLGGLA